MRVSIEKIRKTELAEAAFSSLIEFGFSGTTVAGVAKTAGMSPGLVHHYFKSKADLLAAAMRLVNARYRRRVLEQVGRADSPRAKLYAVVAAGFAPDMFNQGFAQVWLSFCGEAAFSPDYARIQRAMFRRMQSNLSWYLRALLPGDRVEWAARSISMLSHGIWLRCALDENPIDRGDALELVNDLLESLLGPGDQIRAARRE